ncbi:MAG: acyl-protein synthetase [Clostridiales Family XIII bacterium]|jgi:phenylacetate-coenzyme A ligase PaaK-like adenylate-forming protein|nr:acyl-protein synthetase [Clostridiales Family XIII bacterium]
MDARAKLFLRRDPYDAAGSAEAFLCAVRENLAWHAARNPAYRRILDAEGVDAGMIRSEGDLARIPVIPTLYFKRNRLFTVPEGALRVGAASSGTSGSRSFVAFDAPSFRYGLAMVFFFFLRHHVLSPLPTNYIVLGPRPDRILGSGSEEDTGAGAAKTAYGTTKFAPALHREYALEITPSGPHVNEEGVSRALLRYAKQGFPVRFVGLPPYMAFLLSALRENGVKLRLNQKSKVILGGGWKQFASREIDRAEFAGLLRETLGLGPENLLEFYSAVEHPIPYCKCARGHFHVPLYSRAIIRDPVTLAPLPEGRAGLLSFVTPLMTSLPLLSVVTDDLAALRPGADCGCGIPTPYFDLLGRAGAGGAKTCAAEAAELLAKEAG